MPSADTATLTALPVQPSVFQRLAALDAKQKTRLAVGSVLLVLITVVGLVMGRQAEYRVLYANLPEKDGGAIVAQLQQMNIPYQYGAGGSTILVPADRVYDARLKLASQGLPKGSVTGFELMDSASRFGMTQFQERLAFQRGLEGELVRSIQALSSVQSARVHLALPNQNGFFRDQQKPSASVLVSLHGGRTLDRNQIAGIVHLVASSVPEMDPKSVSVLDDTGKLLSNPPDADARGIDAQQLQYTQQIEQLYTSRILDILEPVVGRQNIRAQVTAELDFTQTEQTSEQYRPNQSPDASAIRSQQLLESGEAAAKVPAGVPGAMTNQPPGTAAAPINGQAQALAPAGAASGVGNGRREQIINYELDKTVRMTRNSTGVIKRINAAVVLNHKTVTDAKGKTSTVPLSDAEIEKLTALVRETVGFNKDRGDSVNVVSAAFTVDKTPPVQLPIWQQPEVLDLARSLAWPVGTLLLAALVLLGAIRPALKVMAQPLPDRRSLTLDAAKADAGGLDALEADQPERPMLAGPGATSSAQPAEMSASELALEEARKLTRDNPAAVANIVKAWINGEAPA
ncbi:MAG: flagellar basal-body MS-ring/collar protein FliF [Rhodoferax sp.]